MGATGEMSSSFSVVAETVHGLFSKSIVLGSLGYAEGSRELSEKTPFLPAKCRYSLRPSEGRRLVIDFCYQSDSNHYFVVEVFNVPAADSFLLDEWLSQRGTELNPYPFILSAYVGSERERLAGFVAFLDQHLSAERLAGVLAGRDWEHIPFNWGALK